MRGLKGAGYGLAALCVAAALTAPALQRSASAAPPAGAAHGQPTGTAGHGRATLITLDGRRRGAVFDGIGAISGGGGNSRYLIDYPPAQRTQILNYLFGPGGADLQLLKLEIGGDANSSDGAETSIEHSKGTTPDCDSGYEWWLAEQAVARDPALKLYGLQWAAPGWVGSVWSKADVGYVIDWLNCAASHGLTISYLGGWNERGFNTAWYTRMRTALDSNGYQSVQIVGADAHPGGKHYTPALAWKIASAAAANPALKSAISVLGAHDTCGAPTSGYQCEATTAARRLGLPLWQSEIGEMDGNTGAADMVRLINNGYIQAGMTGYLEWPLVDSMPPGLAFENRGLVTADQPQSGSYHVNRMTWAIAQTTQFTEPGWRHINGANKVIGNSGSYNSYVAPDKSDWTLVAENTGSAKGQHVTAKTIRVTLKGGLKSGDVQVWSTSLWSASPATWFVHRADVHPRAGTFSYSIPAGSVVTFTSTPGQSHLHTTPPAPKDLSLPYAAARDDSNEAWGLSSQEGAFLYEPCLQGVNGDCLEQLAPRVPVLWQKPTAGTPTPYAVVGDDSWSNYTVSASALFTQANAKTNTVSLIGRFGTQGVARNLFNGYEFDLQATGSWQLTRRSATTPARHPLASGRIAAFTPGVWHTISLRLHGAQITATVDGTQVGRVTDGRYKTGLAGIGSSWNLVQFDNLKVS